MLRDILIEEINLSENDLTSGQDNFGDDVELQQEWDTYLNSNYYSLIFFCFLSFSNIFNHPCSFLRIKIKTFADIVFFFFIPQILGQS